MAALTKVRRYRPTMIACLVSLLLASDSETSAPASMR